MSLAPLFQAPLIIQVHAFGAIAAFMLGVIQVAAPKGTLPHKTIGVLWIVVMVVVAATSAFILRPAEPGTPYLERLSIIHLFIPITAFGLVSGLMILLQGGPRLKAHAWPFISVFIGGLIVAGALAFLPGRIMHEVAFGG